jgi:hypothetical protein
MCINYKYTHVTSQKTGIFTNIAFKHTCMHAHTRIHIPHIKANAFSTVSIE